MDTRKPSLDLATELTCSICTELLYQPLTLLDCLHTLCGACLREWFTFQAAAAERAPTPPSPGDNIFTCPSCRSPVRDTKHNATVVTLLEMYVAANPAKARSEADKEEMGKKYRRGDQVFPEVATRKRTAEERRVEDEDQRLLDEVRQMSLREATSSVAQSPGTRRRRDSRSADHRFQPSRTYSSDGRPRRRREGDQHPRVDNAASRSSDQIPDVREGRRRNSSETRQPRQVEHQSSLRSLIGSGSTNERDIEREIEDFARQIQEEGLLDGLDLDNIDLSRDDELSRRITEAYRRRQRERARQEPTRRSNNTAQNGSSRTANPPSVDARRRGAPTGSRAGSRTRTESRSASGNSQTEDRSRPPPSNAASLEGRAAPGRTRRRAASSSRSGTNAAFAAESEMRLTSRSQTDITLRTQPADPTLSRHSSSESRSTGTPSVMASSDLAGERTAPVSVGQNASFASRVPMWNPSVADALSDFSELHQATGATVARPSPTKTQQPAEPAAAHSAASSSARGAANTDPGHHRTRSQLYTEPSITCARCNKPHIEYDLHYNCGECAGGQWNLCLDCYRAGKGCLYWLGFGHGAWTRWEKARQQDKNLERPHMLTANRYLPPPSVQRGGDGRATWTDDDPKGRLETGTFCAKCFVWTNSCFWRCDDCNEGDWGFCNDCVNQGRSCTHRLLPLTHEASQRPSRPGSPRSAEKPTSAAIFTGPQASSIGPFKPLTFRTRCDLCRESIPPTQVRYHCFSCSSALVPDAPPGDYDICTSCYGNLVAQGKISSENGDLGWRRCLNGHRMAVVGFADGRVGQWRYVERDVVGGRTLRAEPFEGSEQHQGQGLQIWSWHKGDEKLKRLATRDVSATAPRAVASTTFTAAFPPDGGPGLRAQALWTWHSTSEADDELPFPRGAEIREVEDVNGDWFFGVYMGAKGLFPAPYVRLSEPRG